MKDLEERRDEGAKIAAIAPCPECRHQQEKDDEDKQQREKSFDCRQHGWVGETICKMPALGHFPSANGRLDETLRKERIMNMLFFDLIRSSS